MMNQRLFAVLLLFAGVAPAWSAGVQQAPIQKSTLAAAHEQAAKTYEEVAKHHRAAAAAYRAGDEHAAKRHASAARLGARQAADLTRESEE